MTCYTVIIIHVYCLCFCISILEEMSSQLTMGKYSQLQVRGTWGMFSRVAVCGFFPNVVLYTITRSADVTRFWMHFFFSYTSTSCWIFLLSHISAYNLVTYFANYIILIFFSAICCILKERLREQENILKCKYNTPFWLNW